MTVHSIHIFDRKGTTLFTKTYSRVASRNQIYLEEQGSPDPDSNPLDEQRKLVFGMMFSLRESILKNLTPAGKDFALHSVQTGAATLHSFQTISGLRFALYTSNDVPSSTNSTRPSNPEFTEVTARDALRHIYSQIWVEYVVRSPLYNSNEIKSKVVDSTSFERKLDEYIMTLPWSRE